MTYLTIALPEAAKAYIVRVASPLENRQISSGNYGTAEEFLTASIAREQERQAKHKVNAMLRSTIQKDRTIEAADEWWEQQHQDLNDRLPPQV